MFYIFCIMFMGKLGKYKYTKMHNKVLLKSLYFYYYILFIPLIRNAVKLNNNNNDNNNKNNHENEIGVVDVIYII